MSSSTVDVSAVPGSTADGASPSRWSRWSDRLNPILVREVTQAVKGRAFGLTVFAALGISVVIALAVVGDGGAGPSSGRNAFNSGLATLAPLLLFVVPMGAYHSMRLELSKGIVEQLLLSRLRPWSIVTGKLLAASVQFVLYVSVMAPLLATSYLLRGVDLPTIALSLVFAALANLGATAAAISGAAQGVVPAMQGLANVGFAFGLGVASFGAVGFIVSGEYLRDVSSLLTSTEFGAVTSAIVLAVFAGMTLSGLVAQSFLMHAFENKSTGFRLFLFAMPIVVFAWLFTFVGPTARAEALSAMLFMLTLLGTVFGIFMTTEQGDLSPRVRAHVPRGRLAALCAAPFLPGRDRGMACVLLYLVAIVALVWTQGPSGSGWSGRMFDGLRRLSTYTAAYAVVYLAIARWLRSRLPASVGGSHAARALLPLVLVAFMVVPLLIDVFVHGEVDDWHFGHVMNPFWTISEFAFRDGHWRITPVLASAAAVVAALQVPLFVRGVREVLAAAAVRRAAKAEQRVAG